MKINSVNFLIHMAYSYGGGPNPQKIKTGCVPSMLSPTPRNIGFIQNFCWEGGILCMVWTGAKHTYLHSYILENLVL